MTVVLDKPESRALRGIAAERRREAEVDQELFEWAERSAAREAGQADAVSPNPAGHLLVTEPQNIALERYERIERGYQELEEAHRR